MRVRYTPQAVEDLVGLAEYLESRNPAAAAKVGAAVRAAVRVFGKHPFSGRAQEAATVRKIVADPHGYLIFYAVNQAESAVDVLAVQHPAQDRGFSDG